MVVDVSGVSGVSIATQGRQSLITWWLWPSPVASW